MKFWHRWFAVNNGENHLYMLMQSLLTMAWFVEARDPYTGGHLWRVSRFARLLADEIGLPDQEAARVSLGGFLHDLGKVGIPDSILRKPESLTEDEYALIKTHPEVGLKMLAGHPLGFLVSDVVGKHHERPDGRGYPKGLFYEQLPFDARIVGLCDAFDAMTSHRPYRSGMMQEKALTILKMEAGRQFDAMLVESFIKLNKKGSLRGVIGHSDDGIPLQECPMCGPTLVIQRRYIDGQRIYCRNCGGEFLVIMTGNENRSVVPTNRKGTPSQLIPDIDIELIAQTVTAMVAALPVDQLAPNHC